MKKRRPLFLALLIVLMLAGVVRAQNFSDVEIKAAYIYKLAKFVTWRGQHVSTVDFCYIESSRQGEEASVGMSLQRLVRAKNAGGQWYIKRLRGVEGIENCDMLFIADSEESSLTNILTKASGLDILTISDARRFIYKDGMIGFVLDDENRVKMEANLKNIRKTNVMVSATVLELMQQVIK